MTTADLRDTMAIIALGFTFITLFTAWFYVKGATNEQ